MRNIFILVFLANIVLTVVSFWLLPAKIAIHFGFGGAPDSWAPKAVNMLILLAVEFPLFILFLFPPSLIVKVPPKFINLPNKDYWLKKENLPMTKAKITSIMSEFGAALFAFLFCISLLTLYANLADPVRLNEGMFFIFFIAFMVYTVYWCVKIFRAFKLPQNKKD
jgi:uncharacterized membrane protein